MNSSLGTQVILKLQAHTHEGKERQESRDKILKWSRATAEEMQHLTTKQLNHALAEMRVELAFEKTYDSTRNGRSKMNYGVYTQGRIFKIAEMEVIILDLEQRLVAERRREQRAGVLRCNWRGVRKMARKLEGLFSYRNRRDGKIDGLREGKHS